MFQQFIEYLSIQLNGELPGQTAQFEMINKERKINLPDLKNLKDYRKSAVCVLLYEHEGKVFFPLIERPQYIGVHSGQIALPGGQFDLTDTTTRETALRELGEETGYFSEKIKILGKLTDVYIPPSNFLVHPYIAFTNEVPLFNPDEKEVKEILLFNIRELMDENLVKETILELGTNKIKTPYFDVQGKVVWGATAMMLSELKAILKLNRFISFFPTQ